MEPPFCEQKEYQRYSKVQKQVLVRGVLLSLMEVGVFENVDLCIDIAFGRGHLNEEALDYLLSGDRSLNYGVGSRLLEQKLVGELVYRDLLACAGDEHFLTSGIQCELAINVEYVFGHGGGNEVFDDVIDELGELQNNRQVGEVKAEGKDDHLLIRLVLHQHKGVIIMRQEGFESVAGGNNVILIFCEFPF